MTSSMQDKWDTRYRDADVAQASACRVLTEFAHLLPKKGRALDLASGLGGNARLLAQYGLDTEAWDISQVVADKLNALAEAQSLPLQARVRDVEQSPPESESFSVIVVSRYLDRARVPALIDALRPSGLMYYETFTREAVDTTGPSDPAFRLAANELLKLFAPLRLVAYREEGRIGDTGHGWRNEAYLIGMKDEG